MLIFANNVSENIANMLNIFLIVGSMDSVALDDVFLVLEYRMGPV